jgi:hypothetical protein
MGNLCEWKIFLIFFLFILSCVVPHSFIFACCFLEIKRRTIGEKNVFEIGKEYILLHEYMEDFFFSLSCLDFLVQGKYLV